MASMQGKLANVVEEIGEVDRASEGIVKQLVSGADIGIERKFKDGFIMTPTARLTFASNVLPRFVDRSDGLWRRLLLIPFGVQIEEEKQDKRLATMEFWEQSGELPGVFNWALEGLRRLQERGYFQEPQACRQVKQRYRMESNPAQGFLEDYCIAQDGATIPSMELYKAYAGYVSELGQHPLGSAQFVRQVERTFVGASLSRNARYLPNGKRGRVWSGLRMRMAYDDEPVRRIEEQVPEIF